MMTGSLYRIPWTTAGSERFLIPFWNHRVFLT